MAKKIYDDLYFGEYRIMFSKHVPIDKYLNHDNKVLIFRNRRNAAKIMRKAGHVELAELILRKD